MQREEDGVQTLLTSGKDAAAAPLQTGALTDAKMAARLDKVVTVFVAFANALAKPA